MVRSDFRPFDRSAPADELLRCELHPERGTVRVRAVGSLDMATAPRLDQQLIELHEAGWNLIVVDLGGLSFMDSSGLRLLLRWDAIARQDGFNLQFAPGPPPVQRVFELTGMTERLPFIGPPDR